MARLQRGQGRAEQGVSGDEFRTERSLKEVVEEGSEEVRKRRGCEEFQEERSKGSVATCF